MTIKMTSDEDISLIKEWLVYDETSRTCLRWKKDKFTGNKRMIKSCAKGEEAGYKTQSGYFAVCLNMKQFRVQRVVCALHDVDVNGLSVDHINRIKTDNRIENLRAVSIAKNSRNRTSKNAANCTGVHLAKKNRAGKTYYAWCATGVDINGKNFKKCYSFKKFGEAQSLVLAKEARLNFMIEQNKLGADYRWDY